MCVSKGRLALNRIQQDLLVSVLPSINADNRSELTDDGVLVL